MNAPSKVISPAGAMSRSPALVNVTVPSLRAAKVLIPAFMVIVCVVRSIPPIASRVTRPSNCVSPVPAFCVIVFALTAASAVTSSALAITSSPRSLVAPTARSKSMLPPPAVKVRSSIKSVVASNVLWKVIVPMPAPVFKATRPPSVKVTALKKLIASAVVVISPAV